MARPRTDTENAGPPAALSGVPDDAIDMHEELRRGRSGRAGFLVLTSVGLVVGAISAVVIALSLGLYFLLS